MKCAAAAVASWLVWIIAAGPTALVGINAVQAQTQEAPFNNEAAARACVHKRLAELLAQNRPNIAGDAALGECTNGGGLRNEPCKDTARHEAGRALS